MISEKIENLIKKWEPTHLLTGINVAEKGKLAVKLEELARMILENPKDKFVKEQIEGLLPLANLLHRKGYDIESHVLLEDYTKLLSNLENTPADENFDHALYCINLFIDQLNPQSD